MYVCMCIMLVYVCVHAYADVWNICTLDVHMYIRMCVNVYQRFV